MSSSSTPNAIRIPVIVEIDKATGALMTLRRTADTETKAAAASMQANLGAAEKNVTASFASATKSATSFKDAVRGAGPAITGLSAALGQSVGPLGAFSRSILSIASNGFTPLGLAIGAATAATALWIEKSSDGTAAARKEADAVDKLAESWSRATDSLKALGIERYGKTSGLGTQGAKDVADLEELQAQLVDAEDSRSQILRDMRGLSGRGGLSLSGIASGSVAQGLQADLKAIDDTIWKLRNLVSMSEHVRDSRIAVAAAGQPSLAASPGVQLTAREEALGGLSFYEPTSGGAALRPEVAATRAAQIAAAKEQRRGMADLMAGRDYIGDSTKFSGFGGPAHTGNWGVAEPVPFTPSVIEPTAAQKYAKSFGDAFTSGVTDAAMNLANTRDIGGFFRSITDQMHQSIYNGIISGFIEGTGLRSAAASLGQQLFGAGASAAKVGAGGTGGTPQGDYVSDFIGGPKSAKAGGGDTIVVVADFSGQADEIAMKMSHRGARAVVAKVNGQGVAAGSIPTRRRG